MREHRVVAGRVADGAAVQRDRARADREAVVVSAGGHRCAEAQRVRARAVEIGRRQGAAGQIQQQRGPAAADVDEDGLAEGDRGGDGVARIQPAVLGVGGSRQRDGVHFGRPGVDGDRVLGAGAADVAGRITEDRAQRVGGAAGEQRRGDLLVAGVDVGLRQHDRITEVGAAVAQAQAVARDRPRARQPHAHDRIDVVGAAAVGHHTLHGALVVAHLDDGHRAGRGGVDAVGRVIADGGHVRGQRRAGAVDDGAAVQVERVLRDGDAVDGVVARSDLVAEGQHVRAAAGVVAGLHGAAAEVQGQARRAGDGHGLGEGHRHGHHVALVEPACLGTGGRSQRRGRDGRRRLVDDHVDRRAVAHRLVGRHDAGTIGVAAVGQRILRAAHVDPPAPACGQALEALDRAAGRQPRHLQREAVVGADAVTGQAGVGVAAQAQAALDDGGGVDPVVGVVADRRVRAVGVVAGGVAQGRVAVDHELVGRDGQTIVIILPRRHRVDELQGIGAAAAGVDGVHGVVAHLQLEHQRAAVRDVGHRLGEGHLDGHGAACRQRLGAGAAGGAGQHHRVHRRRHGVDGHGHGRTRHRVPRRIADTRAEEVAAIGQARDRRVGGGRPVGAAIGRALVGDRGIRTLPAQAEGEGGVVAQAVAGGRAVVIEADQAQRAGRGRCGGVDLEQGVRVAAGHRQVRLVARHVADRAAVQVQRARGDGDARLVVLPGQHGVAEGQRGAAAAASVGGLHRLAADHQVHQRRTHDVDHAVEGDGDDGDVAGVQVVVGRAFGGQRQRADARRRGVDRHRQRVAAVADVAGSIGLEPTVAIGAVGQVLRRARARPGDAVVGGHLITVVHDEAVVARDEVVVRHAGVVEVGQGHRAGVRRDGVDPVVRVAGDCHMVAHHGVAGGVLQSGVAVQHQVVGVDRDAVAVVVAGGHGVDEFERGGAAAGLVDGVDELPADVELQHQAAAARRVEHRLGELDACGHRVAGVQPHAVGRAGGRHQRDGADRRRRGVDRHDEGRRPTAVARRVDDGAAEVVGAVGQVTQVGRHAIPVGGAIQRRDVADLGASLLTRDEQGEVAVVGETVAHRAGVGEVRDR